MLDINEYKYIINQTHLINFQFFNFKNCINAKLKSDCVKCFFSHLDYLSLSKIDHTSLEFKIIEEGVSECYLKKHSEATITLIEIASERAIFHNTQNEEELLLIVNGNGGLIIDAESSLI